MSRKPQTIGGRGSSSRENYDPKARDGDSDGNVQEGTEFMRAANPRTGTADSMERDNIRADLEKRGFDGEAFKKLMDAESRKLKPGQKTNWNPGRLPNGGKIALDGTYISPDMIREEDNEKKRRGRSKEQTESPRSRIPREGDVAPEKNRDRISSSSKPVPKPPANPKEREKDVVLKPKSRASSSVPTPKPTPPIAPNKPSVLLPPVSNSPTTTQPRVQFNPPATTPPPKVGPGIPPNRPPVTTPPPRVGPGIPPNRPPVTTPPPRVGPGIPPNRPPVTTPPPRVEEYKEYVRSRINAYKEEKAKSDTEEEGKNSRTADKDKKPNPGTESKNPLSTMPDDGNYSYKGEFSLNEIEKGLREADPSGDWNEINNPIISQLWKLNSVKNLNDGEVILVKDLPTNKSRLNISGAEVLNMPPTPYAAITKRDNMTFVVELNKAEYNKIQNGSLSDKNLQNPIAEQLGNIPKDLKQIFDTMPESKKSGYLEQITLHDAAYPENKKAAGIALPWTKSFSSFKGSDSMAVLTHEIGHMIFGQDDASAPYKTDAYAYNEAIINDNKVSKDLLTSSEYVMNDSVKKMISPIGIDLHGLSSSGSNITLYAEENSAEDWAESFMYYNADKMYGHLIKTSDGRKLGFADLYPNKAKIINEWMESKTQYEF